MMVRFRLWGDRSSTLEGIVAGESASIADRWSLGKGLALTSSREIAIVFLRFAFACTVAATIGETPAPSSDCALDAWRRLVDTFSAIGFSSDKNLEFRGNFDVRIGGRFGAREGGSDSAGVGAASGSVRRNDSSGTRLGRIRPFGDDALQRGTDPPSPPRTPQWRHGATLDQILLAVTWLRTIARLALTWSHALAAAGLQPWTREQRVSMLSSIALAVRLIRLAEDLARQSATKQ